MIEKTPRTLCQGKTGETAPDVDVVSPNLLPFAGQSATIYVSTVDAVAFTIGSKRDHSCSF
jgi:hypothetical protein